MKEQCINSDIEAFPLIVFDTGTNNFKVTEEGFELFNKVESPFRIVCIAGMYRTGKSYLINKLLLDNPSKGFSVGSTVNSCTKGLWIWPTPINSVGIDGKNITTFIVDTEGFGACEQDQNHDFKIFVLALLCSSLFIYNSVGTIDEAAIQSLSFVVNLAKKLSSSAFTQTEQSNYFPQLLWVVRDFSLQLQDEQGRPISSNDYLDLVLNTVSKSSDKSNDDSKNQIRNSIKQFFTSRACCTLVRPVTDENKLQKLSTIPDSELRSEFIEQSLSLKQLIKKNAKSKQFNGVCCNGESFISLINDVVQQINQDTMPKVGDLFTSICISEAGKAVEECLESYESKMKEGMSSPLKSKSNIFSKLKQKDKEKESSVAFSFTLSVPEFNSLHDEASDRSQQLFLDKIKFAVQQSKNGPKFILKELEEIFERLEDLIKEKHDQLFNILIDQIKTQMIKVLHSAYSDIEMRLQSGKIKAIEDNLESLNIEIEKTQTNLNSMFPQVEFVNEYYHDFKSNVLSMVIGFIAQKHENQILFLKQDYEAMINGLSNEKKEIEVKLKSSDNKQEELTNTLKAKINELKSELNDKRGEIAAIEKEKSSSIKALNDKITQLKDDAAKKLTELTLKIELANEKVAESDRSRITAVSEYEKEKVLLTQVIEHQTKQIEELRRLDKESNKELMSHVKEHQNALKDSNIKNEKTITDLNNKIVSLNEKIIDYESQIYSLKQDLDDERKKQIDSAQDSKAKFELLDKESQRLKQLNESDKQKFIQKLRDSESNMATEIARIQEKSQLEIEELNSKIAKMKDDLSRQQGENKHLLQELDFSKKSEEDLNGKLKYLKESQNDLIRKVAESAGKSLSNEEMKLKIEEMRELFEKEKTNLCENYDKAILQLQSKIEQLNEVLAKEIKYGEVEKNDLQKEISDYKLKLDNCYSDLSNTQKKYKELEIQFEHHEEEHLEEIVRLKQEFELNIEKVKHSSMKEVSDLNTDSEEQLRKLKTMFDFEKVKLDEKLRNEKAAADRKLKSSIQDYENRLSELEMELRNEIEILTNELAGTRKDFEDYINRAEKEVDLLKQSKETLEGLWEASKQALIKNQMQYKQSYESQQESNSKERGELIRRIETLTSEYAKIDKDLLIIQIKKEQSDKEFSELQKLYQNSKMEMEEEKKEMKSFMDRMNTKLNDVSEEFTIKQLEYTRENALLKQQIEFLNKKIEDLKELNEVHQAKYEEKLFSLRIEVEKECEERYNRLEKEKIVVESKLTATKKELRDLEQTFFKQTALIEKEKAKLEERLESSENNIREKTEYYQKEIESVQLFKQSLKENYQKELDDFNSSNEFLKQKIFRLEEELKEKMNTFQKEKSLLENRCGFLENQRDEYKTKNNELTKESEAKLVSIQDKSQKDLDKLRQQYEYQASTSEAKYKRHVSELQESHQNMYVELVNTNKQLERELKSLQLQSEINNRKGNDPSMIAKKVQELLDLQESLKIELDSTKQEKDKRIREVIEMAEHERDQFSQKISLLENRIREAESKRSNLVIEYERSSASWSIERSQMASRINDLEEIRSRMEEKLESYSRENDKLKSARPNNFNAQGSHLRNKSSNVFDNKEAEFINQVNPNNMRGAPSNFQDYFSNAPYNKAHTNINSGQNPGFQGPPQNINSGNTNVNYSYNHNPQSINKTYVTNTKKIVTSHQQAAQYQNNNSQYKPNYGLSTPDERLNSSKVNVSQMSKHGPLTGNNNYNYILSPNNNPDLSNIEPDEYQLDDRFLEKNLLDSSFSSTNSLKLEMQNPTKVPRNLQQSFQKNNTKQDNSELIKNSQVYYKKKA